MTATDLDPIRELWAMLLDAERAAARAPGGSTTREARLGYRNGLLDAYLLITGKDEDEVGEALRYESHGA